jgi:hypothetical protein
MITSIVAAVLAIVYRYVCLWENARRDKLGAEAYDHAYEDDLTDIKVCFLPLPLNCFPKRWLIRLVEPTVPVPSLIVGTR